MKRFLFFILPVLLVAYSSSLFACTTFCLKHDKALVFGKNYDWNIGYGLVFINKRGIEKASAVAAGETALSWVSKYGSVSFNQYGREFPLGGMNEAGLVIELMWLDDSEYPAPDERPAIGTTQWIQYQLDMAGSVNELLQLAKKVRITSRSAKIHYLVCDRSGKTATIEYLKGDLVVHSGRNMPTNALANSTYAASCNYLERFAGFGGNKFMPDNGHGSLDRFARASSKIKYYRPKKHGPPVDYAFGILDDVAQGDYTQWNIVYDISNMQIYYRTAEQRDIKQISMDSQTFDCASPTQVLDIQRPAIAGNVAAYFEPYSSEANYNLIRKSYRQTRFLQHISDADIRENAKFGNDFSCSAKPANSGVAAGAAERP